MSSVPPLLLLTTLCLILPQCMSELCPPGCTCMINGWQRMANCRGGSLSSILSSLTPEFTSVIIKITANARNLQPQHFQPISHIPLTQLAIDESWVNNVQSGTFETLTRLEELSLRHNMLSAISPDVFLGLSNLKKLDLSNNRIKNIENMLNSLYRLEHLDLSYNHLSDLRTECSGPSYTWCRYGWTEIVYRISMVTYFKACRTSSIWVYASATWWQLQVTCLVLWEA